MTFALVYVLPVASALSEAALDALRLLIAIVVVPGILVAMLGLAWQITVVPADRDADRLSRLMAFFLGLAVFVLVATLNIYGDLFVPDHSLDASDRPWRYIVVGVVLGAAVMAATHSFLKYRAVAIFITVLTAASTTSLYLYIFVDDLRGAILLLSIGLLVGALLYVVIEPEAIKDVRRAPSMPASQTIRRRRFR